MKPSEKTPRQPILLIHGGAWDMPDDAIEAHKRGIANALAAGWAALERGGTSVDAVEAAVTIMEDDDTFDAGRGSFLTRDGRVQLDALLMNGENLRTGGVACVERLKNPIQAARLVLEKSPHVYFVGNGAERFATQHGMRLIDNTELIVPRERQRLMDFQRSEAAGGIDTTFTGTSQSTTQPSPATSKGDGQSSPASFEGGRQPSSASSKGGRQLSPATSEGDQQPPPASFERDRQIPSATSEGDRQPSSASFKGDGQSSPASFEGDGLQPVHSGADSNAALAAEGNADTPATAPSKPSTLGPDPSLNPTLHSHDTVGAVALDQYGNLAAATSTGGTLSKAPGRVGDSSLIGCGCYADNLSAAVSLTGWGEPIMKLVLGKWAVDRVLSGAHPQEAASAAIDYLYQRLGGHGGIILLGPDGSIGLAHNTPRMAWGIATPTGHQLGITRN